MLVCHLCLGLIQLFSLQEESLISNLFFNSHTEKKGQNAICRPLPYKGHVLIGRYSTVLPACFKLQLFVQSFELWLQF